MREKLIELLMDAMPSCYSDTFASQIADHLIANDVVPVVRCKDCNNLVPESITVCRYCSLTGMQVVDEDDFCSYGERRTDG